MSVDVLVLARVVHVIGLVHWIGGVAVVTTIVLPRALKLPDAREALVAFEAFERPFASQARVSILLVGLSGLYMVAALDAWDRFRAASFWWLHLMVGVWALFAVMVFIAEPLFIHRHFCDYALQNKQRAFAVAIALHALALGIATLAICAGVIGAHGGL